MACGHVWACARAISRHSRPGLLEASRTNHQTSDSNNEVCISKEGKNYLRSANN